MPHKLAHLAGQLIEIATRRSLTVVTAESCTAGLLAETLSDAPGAATSFHGSFVAYTKAQKIRALDVPATLLEEQGAVCLDVARHMAEGALRHSPADLSAAITGVAGPEPDEDDNPVGRVCIAVARRGEPARPFARDYGAIGRDAIRRAAVGDALDALLKLAWEAA
jgi:nicotinamide-nucleotide amidase